jgi:MFS-type transporter involved in bile tolerance (Atg22 family)
MTLATVAIPANLITGFVATKFGLAKALMLSSVFSALGLLILVALLPKLNPTGDAT